MFPFIVFSFKLVLFLGEEPCGPFEFLRRLKLEGRLGFERVRLKPLFQKVLEMRGFLEFIKFLSREGFCK